MLEFKILPAPSPAPSNLLPAGLARILPGLKPPATVSTVFFRDTAGALYLEQVPQTPGVAPFAELWPAIEAAELTPGAAGDVSVDKERPIALGPNVAPGDAGGAQPVGTGATGAGTIGTGAAP